MPMVTLKLDIQAVNFIIQLLGEQPTKSNVYPLVMDIQNQATNQTGQADAPANAPPVSPAT